MDSRGEEKKEKKKELTLVLSEEDKQLLNQFLDTVITLILQKIEQDYTVSRKNNENSLFEYRV